MFFNPLLICGSFLKGTAACGPITYFSQFLFISDVKKVFKVNFRNAVQIKLKKQAVKKIFPVTLDMKAK